MDTHLHEIISSVLKCKKRQYNVQRYLIVVMVFRRLLQAKWLKLMQIMDFHYYILC